MAGIYIHIPFCKSKCSYCDFFSATDYNQQTELLAAMKKELFLQKEYLKKELVSTIYFGGGTPSTLSAENILDIINSINTHFQLAENVEITLEANPDDLNISYLQNLRKNGLLFQYLYQSIGFLLQRPHAGVFAAQGQKIRVIAALDDAACVHHHDLVCVRNGR